MDFRVISTKRNGTGLLVNGFQFRIHQTLADKKHWKCVNEACRSRCHTDVDVTRIIKEPGDHTGHPPDVAKTEAVRLVADMKKTCEELPELPVKWVYDRVLGEMDGAENAEDIARHFPQFHQVKSTLYRQRWKNTPRLPNTLKTPESETSCSVMTDDRPKVLVGCTGSVASVKIPPLLDALASLPCQPEVQLVTTKNSRHFFDVGKVSCPMYTDEDEWGSWSSLSDPVLHIELRRWADMMVIAPLDANTLAKLAGGICDNLLTCIVRAWDLERPLLFAPAMNTHMWQHPLTAEHVTKLKGWGYIEVPCISKKLACGDTGKGAMAEVSTIAAEVDRVLNKPRT